MSMPIEPYENVVELFKSKNCVLLTKKEEYINGNTKVEYICTCGEKIIRSINKFKISIKINGNAFCRYCSPNNLTKYEKLKKTCLKKYGKDNYFGSSVQKEKFLEEYGVDCYSKTEEFKLKSKNTCLEKYGVDCAMKTPETKEKYRQTCIEKYGVDSYSKTEEYKIHLKDTLLERYGVDNIGHFNTKLASRESKNLFKEIFEKVPDNLKVKCHYSLLKDGEFCIKYNNMFFKYDFVNSITKTCIEYNGYNFHPKPEQLDEEIGWFAFDKNRTVKEARDYEKIKYEGLEVRGYKILTVWDYEYKSNPTLLIDKCVQFIISGSLP